MSSLLSDRKVVTTAGTAVQLPALTGAAPLKGVMVQAETDNTGLIVYGGSTVVAALATRKGVALTAGQSVFLEVDDLQDVYLDTTVNGDGVTYTAVLK